MIQKRRFLAELVFRLHDVGQPQEVRFDKHFLSLLADSEREAYQSALVAASHELDNRAVYTKDKYVWEFIGMEHLEEIRGVAQSETHSTILDAPKNIPAFIQALRFKSAAIQMQLGLTA